MRTPSPRIARRSWSRCTRTTSPLPGNYSIKVTRRRWKHGPRYGRCSACRCWSTPAAPWSKRASSSNTWGCTIPARSACFPPMPAPRSKCAAWTAFSTTTSRPHNRRSLRTACANPRNATPVASLTRAGCWTRRTHGSTGRWSIANGRPVTTSASPTARRRRSSSMPTGRTASTRRLRRSSPIASACWPGHPSPGPSTKRVRTAPCSPSVHPTAIDSGFQPVATAEDPPHHGQADQQEDQGHAQADGHADVGYAIEAPAEAADQVHHGVEQGDLLPERGEHVDRVETAAEEGQRRHDQQGHELQLLEIVRPDADDEAEQAERHRGQHQEREHPQRMLDPERYEQPRRGEDDQAERHGFGRRRAHVAGHDLKCRYRRREDLVDRAHELREIDAERGVRDALRQQRQHDQARHDEGAVADPVDPIH